MATQEEREKSNIIKKLPDFNSFKRVKVAVKDWKYFLDKGISWNNPHKITAKKFY